MMTRNAAAVAILCLVAGSSSLAAPSKRIADLKEAKAKKAKKAQVMKAKDAVRAVGTVIYDTGSPTAGFYAGVKSNVGNRFDSANGGPLLNTGQVSIVTFFPNLSAGFVTLFGPPTGGGAAPNLGSFSAGGLIPSAFNAVNVGAVGVGPDFLAGAWQVPPSLLNGMDNMSVGGQGFHAFDLVTNFPGSGTNFAPLPGLNALVRSTGNILVPVELMNFQVQ